MATYWSKILCLAFLVLTGCSWELDITQRAGGASWPAGSASAHPGDGPPTGGNALPPKYGSNANYAYAVGFGASSVPWTAGFAAPTITQTAPTSDVATQPLTITSQAPYASATTNIAPGDIRLNVPLPASGTTYGHISAMNGGTQSASIGAYSTSYGGFWGTVGTPNVSNWAIISAGTTTQFNATSNLYFDLNGSAQIALQSGSWAPYTDSALTDGTTSTRWSTVYALNGLSAGNTPASDLAPSNMTISPQGPYSGATVHTSSASLIFNEPAPVGSGLYGLTKFQAGGTDNVSVGSYAGVAGGSTAYGAIWFMDAGAPSSTNFGFLGNQSVTYLNVPASGEVSMSIGGAQGTGLDLTSTFAALRRPLGGVSGGAAFSWESGTVALTSGTGNVLTNTQYSNPHIKFTGTLTGSGTTVTFPATDGACWDLDFSAVTTIADSIALIANGVTWGTAVAGVSTEFPHICYSAGAGRLVGTAMTQ